MQVKVVNQYTIPERTKSHKWGFQYAKDGNFIANTIQNETKIKNMNKQIQQAEVDLALFRSDHVYTV